MATVTGFTASRMIALENSTVVGGTIAGDDLILQQHDGVTINAGNVRGPQGPAGINGTNGATGQGWVPVEIGNAKNLDNFQDPGTYSQTQRSEAVSGTNYPTPYAGFLEVVSTPGGFTKQVYTVGDMGSPTSPDLNNSYVRFCNAGSWTPWVSQGSTSSPYLSVILSTSQNIPNSEYTRVVFQTVEENTLFSYNAGTGEATVQVAGRYMILGTCVWTNNGTGRRIVRLRKGSTELSAFTNVAEAVTYYTTQAQVPERLEVGDVVTMDAFQESGATRQVVSYLRRTRLAISYMGP